MGAIRCDAKIPRDEDLVWMFCHAEGDSGVCSSFGPMVNVAMGGGGGGDHERSIRDGKYGLGSREGSVSRARRLRTRFMALPKRHQDVLFLVYGATTFPPETLRPLGQLAGVSLITKAAEAGYAASLLKPKAKVNGLGAWLVSACVRGANAELEPVRREAIGLVTEALAAWWGLAGKRRVA